MKYWELAVETSDAGTELVAAALNRSGIENVSIEESHAAVAAFLSDAKLYWDFADSDKLGVDTPRVIAYIEDGEDASIRMDEARHCIEELKTMDIDIDLGSLKVTTKLLDDADWLNAWKESYKPMPIGERLLVVPSWERVEQDDGRVKLTLDPGMAFGSGAHHTTRMCLELLEEVVREGDAVIDLGCGSGILSIASALLGAGKAVAVDIDPIAEKVARENAALNGIGMDNYEVLIGDVLSDEALQQKIAGQYDVVLANIVANVIIRLAPLAKQLVKDGAPFIVSGIIAERKDEVVTALEEAGFTVEKTLRGEDWYALRLR